MDPRTSRWLQLKRLQENEIYQFHALERTAGNEGGLIRLPSGPWAGYVVATALGYLHGLNERLAPYWDKSKTDAERGAEIKAFERHIYPLWCSRLAPDSREYPDSLTALHAADLAIWRDDWVINRMGGGPQASKALATVFS